MTLESRIIARLTRTIVAATALAAFVLVGPLVAASDDGGAGIGAALSPVWILPFALLLGAIAVCPLFAPHWWDRNRNKATVSLCLSLPVACFFVTHDPHALADKAYEYFSFIVLLGALFVIAGGILIRGSFSGTPLFNTLALAVGAVLASVVGTTGASMLLIRPVLRANRNRLDKAHIIVFFIFLVSNIGGCLTPLGDPPLFLGFLQGVPFEWTLRLAAPWAVSVAALLIVFNLLDRYKFHREDVETPGDLDQAVESKEGIRIDGKLNFLFLAGVVLAVFLCGRFHDRVPKGAQEAAMAFMAWLSLEFTPKAIRGENGFRWGPILEVAILFAGIFVTMTPALLILNARGGDLGVSAPWHFFWASGILSSVLDNAPTYLTFLSLAQGCGFPNEVVGVSHAVLAAIACGSVFMGANTYIGNGPNFMVKAIAEEAGVKMPSFFHYMGYSGAILIPLFAALTLAFFR